MLDSADVSIIVNLWRRGFMDKFLTVESGSSSGATHKKRKLPAGFGLMTLHQCKKTVTLHGHTAMNFSIADVQACKTALEEACSSTQKLDQLRKLSVMHINKSHLAESQVAKTVRALAKSEDAEVARVAQRVIDKWKRQVLQQHSPQAGVAKIGNMRQSGRSQTNQPNMNSSSGSMPDASHGAEVE